MNKLKRTLALVATLAISATAFVGCGDDNNSSSSSKEDSSSSAADETSAAEGGESSTAEGEAGYTGSLKTGGDKMTILCWTPDDVNPMLEMWKGDTGYTDDQINFVNFSVGGGEAAAQYDQYFLGGDDVDLFMVEADWALKYINDDSATAPMSELGFKPVSMLTQWISVRTQTA